MGPINYMAAMPEVDFLSSIQGGLKLGAALRESDAKIAEKQLAIEQQRAYLTDAQAYLEAPTAKGAAALALKYPKQREAVKQAWDGLEESERTDQGRAMGQTYTALLSNRPDIAQQTLQQRIEARKNAGMDTAQEENILTILQDNPDQAKAAVGFVLSQVSDPKEFASKFASLEAERRNADAAPADLAKKQADAVTARNQAGITGAKAAVAGQSEALGLAKAAEDVETAKFDRQIKTINATIAREDNDIKRAELELKRDALIEKRDTTKREKTSEAEQSLATVDQTLATIGRVRNHPGFDAAVGGTALFPTMPGSDARDFEGQIETLKSQAFLAQIPQMKGLGALTEAEGSRLVSSIGNLDIKQSEKSLKGELASIEKIFQGARERMVKKYGAAGTPAAEGEVLIQNHPKFGTVTTRKANEIARQAGMTLDEVNQFLRETAGGR